jgi:TIR domain
MATVFISYRSADRRRAERLAAVFRSRGHDVWLDTWNIKVGDSIVEKINAGLQDASHVVICYSDTGSLSPWMSREWMSTLARQLEGAGIHLLPARLSGGSPPAILADIKYADLVQNWTLGIEALCDALR